MKETIKKGEENWFKQLLTDIQSLIQTLYYISQGQLPSDTKALSVSELVTDGLESDEMDSTTVLHTNGSYQLTDDSTPQIDSQQVIEPSPQNDAPPPPPSRETHLYQNLMFILLIYQQRVNDLSHESDPISSFRWQSYIHYHVNEQSCHMTSVGVALSYGFHYSGGYSLSSLAPPTERLMIHLLRIMNQHLCGLVTAHQVRERLDDGEFL